MPVTILEAEVNIKPNFCAIAFIGAVCNKPPMISVGITKNRLTFQGIEKNKEFSVNIPSKGQLLVTDLMGIVSGRETNKADFFSIFYGELKKAPLIAECLISMGCEVIDILEYGGSHKIIIAEIKETYVDNNVVSEKHILNIEKLDPIVLSLQQRKYYQLGSQAGNAWKDGQKIRK